MFYKNKRIILGLFATISLFAVSVMTMAQAPKQSIGSVANAEIGKKVYWDQRLDNQVSPGTPFKDENGKDVKIGDYFKTKPIILMMPFYKCPGTCTLEMEGAIHACNAIDYELGKDYEMVVVSIDSREGPDLAAAKRADYLATYKVKGAERGLHCLTGTKESIDKLSEDVGFHYMIDPKTGGPIHSAGMMVLTPHGKMSRYLFGVEYGPRNLNLAVVEASENKIGNLSEKITLLCSMYDVRNGRYSIAIIRILQIAGCGTALLLGTFIFSMLRMEKMRKINKVDEIAVEKT